MMALVVFLEVLTLSLREKFIAKNRQVDDASEEGRLIYFKQFWEFYLLAPWRFFCIWVWQSVLTMIR